MSTHCRIGVRDDQTGAIQSIYCHFDGYVHGVGNRLVRRYQDPGKIRRLLALGDISFLGESEEESGWDTYDTTKTRSYRSRGEDNVRARTAKSLEGYRRQGRNCGAEYLYLWTNGVWVDVTRDGSVVILPGQEKPRDTERLCSEILNIEETFKKFMEVKDNKAMKITRSKMTLVAFTVAEVQSLLEKLCKEQGIVPTAEFPPTRNITLNVLHDDTDRDRVIGFELVINH